MQRRRVSVLLTGGDRALLASARSLSGHGISYAVIGVGPSSMVGASRYVRPHMVGQGPNATSDPEAYVAFVLDVVQKYDVRLVLPLSDRTIFTCDQHREAIEASVRLAAPPSPAVRNVLDKRRNLQAARRLGIPCPAQFELERVEQLPELIEELGFPMVLKNPGLSADGRRSPFRFRWLVARNEHELRGHVAEHCSSGVFPLFQQLVTGAVRNVCCFACEGEIAGAHEYRSIRRRRGMSAFREITPVASDLRGYAESMLGELRWDGAAQLGFFVRESDGDVRYMETNGRLWGAVSGSVAAGWDFPYWTYRYFMDAERPAPPQSLGIGRRSRWAYGDLEALLAFLAGDDEVAGAGRSRPRAVADYISGFKPGVDSDVFRLDDPLPQLVEHWRGARLAISRYRHRKPRGRLGAS